MRAHRIYRVLATQLDRNGYAVMRFDYGGTGDSMGDGEDVTIESCLEDVAMAVEHVRGASGATKLVVIGLRLGATFAALATSRGALRARHLVLWDPVVEGGAYLRELGAMHERYMRQEMGDAFEREARSSPDGVPTESLGAPISAALACELRALDLASEALNADHVTIALTSSTPAVARLRERLPESPAARWLDMPGTAAWNSDAALNAATVPTEVVQALLARVEEVSP